MDPICILSSVIGPLVLVPDDVTHLVWVPNRLSLHLPSPDPPEVEVGTRSDFHFQERKGPAIIIIILIIVDRIFLVRNQMVL